MTVRIEAKLRDYVTDRFGNHIKRAGRLSETVRLREFWTLRRNGHGHWILASIEQGAEGAHVLDEEIVADALSDDQSTQRRGADRGRGRRRGPGEHPDRRGRRPRLRRAMRGPPRST